MPLRGLSGFKVLLDNRWRYVGTMPDSSGECWPVAGLDEDSWFISGCYPVNEHRQMSPELRVTWLANVNRGALPGQLLSIALS